jgi:hypothetical protein
MGKKDTDQESIKQTEEQVDLTDKKSANGTPEMSATEDDDDDDPIVLPLVKRAYHWFWAHKKLTIPTAVVLILAVTMAWPVSRYKVLGVAIKKDFSIIVKDSVTGLPVSDVQINMRGHQATTNSEGIATISKISVGSGQLSATKKYYVDKQQDILVGLSATNGPYVVTIEANGRQVPLQVVNRITGQKLAGADIEASGTSAKTDDNGEAVLVLPPDQTSVPATVSLDGYNVLRVNIKVTTDFDGTNKFSLVPYGKIYFLSKRTGQINVMKSNLDGTSAKVVVKATGSEDDRDTILLASKDWRYLALKAKRGDNKTGRLYLLDTQNDKLTEIDGGNEATIEFTGWVGHQFVYKVHRTNVDYWKANKEALKSFNAETGEISLIDQNRSNGKGYSQAAYEDIATVHTIGGKIVYFKTWDDNNRYLFERDKYKPAIYAANPDGSDRQTLQEFKIRRTETGYSFYYDGSINSVQSEPNEIYFSYTDGRGTEYYTYEDGRLFKDDEMTSEEFYKNYPTFLESPGSGQTFWSEERDGKNTMFVGDVKAENEKNILSISDHRPYGWFTDNYVLVSKDGSELYIMPMAGPGTLGLLMKITDYHRPSRFFYGYGGGYGGI